jgi:hypothetical protein
MNPIKSIACAVFSVALSFAALPSFAAGPAKASKDAPPSNQREVNYQELEKHVGAHVVVNTTNGTMRSGTLLKYTNVALVVKLGPEAGSIELSMPRNTVRKVSVTTAAADPLFPSDTTKQETDSGAKKN